MINILHILLSLLIAIIGLVVTYLVMLVFCASFITMHRKICRIVMSKIAKRKIKADMRADYCHYRKFIKTNTQKEKKDNLWAC